MEPIGQTLVVPLRDSSQVALARRTARAQALRVGLPESRADDVEIAAVELATNLLHHASGGTLLINPFVHSETLELLSVDSGPGMADLEACSEDGYSTNATPGFGLGSIKRLSNSFEAYSWPSKGTVIAARFEARHAIPPLPGVVCTAMPGEHVSGDRWAFRREGNTDAYLVVDGLGHGLHASEAATMAVEIFLNTTLSTPGAPSSELVQKMHGPMRGTRGAALALIYLERDTHTASYCGVGNISSRILTTAVGTQPAVGTGRVTHLISQNGTVGHQARQIRSFAYPYRDGDLLVMHSDGISTHWSLDSYPELDAACPSAVAATLHRDFSRGRDDATALAVRL
jgi:anti-sigma regulatory factor (Ser/Thr protein kinase)